MSARENGPLTPRRRNDSESLMRSPESEYRAREVRQRQDAERRNPRIPLLSAKQVETARSERKDGMSWADLGRRFGTDGITVRRLVEGTR